MSPSGSRSGGRLETAQEPPRRIRLVQSPPFAAATPSRRSARRCNSCGRNPRSTPRHCRPYRRDRNRSARMSRPAPFAGPLAAAAVAVGHRLSVELDVVAPRIRRRRSGARRIFVFGLGEQPIGLAGHLREPRHVLLRVVPIDVDRWLLPAAPALVARLITIAAAAGDAGVPVGKSQLIFRYSKGFGNRDCMLWMFVRRRKPSSSAAIPS